MWPFFMTFLFSIFSLLHLESSLHAIYNVSLHNDLSVLHIFRPLFREFPTCPHDVCGDWEEFDREWIRHEAVETEAVRPWPLLPSARDLWHWKQKQWKSQGNGQVCAQLVTFQDFHHVFPIFLKCCNFTPKLKFCIKLIIKMSLRHYFIFYRTIKIDTHRTWLLCGAHLRGLRYHIYTISLQLQTRFVTHDF